MTSYRRRLLALVCAAFAIWFMPREVRACSICQPGDALYSPEGAGAQSAGSFNFYVENRHTWKSSGVLPHGHGGEEGEGEEEEHTHDGDRERAYDRDVTFWASWTPVSRLTLSASVPYRWITMDFESSHGGTTRERNRGWGDAALYGTAVLWRDQDHAPTTWVEARTMLKLPTGSSEKSIGGDLDPHIQVGTGSWDWGFGLAGVRRFERGNVYASAFYRVNQQGSLDYTYGAAVLANLVYSTPTFALAPLGGMLVRPGTELNFRYAGKDVSDGQRYDSSGGSIVYLTPFVELPLSLKIEERTPWLRLALRMPLGDGGLHGYQHESFVFLAGLGIPF